jgi:hypothetical protein
MRSWRNSRFSALVRYSKALSKPWMAWVTSSRSSCSASLPASSPSAAVEAGALVTLATETRLFGLDGTGLTPRDRSRVSRGLAKRRDRIYGGWRITVGRDAKKRQNTYALVAAG